MIGPYDVSGNEASIYLDAKGAGWTAVHRDGDDLSTVGVMPIRNDSKTIGFATVDIRLGELKALLASVVAASQSIAFIMEEDNTYSLIAVSDFSFVADADENQLAAYDSPNAVVNRTARGLIKEGMPLEKTRIIGSYYVTASRITKFGDLNLDTPWIFVVSQPIECPVGYAVSNISLTCQSCAYSYNSIGGGAQCSICSRGFYLRSDEGSECLPCPRGSQCKGGITVPIPLSGFWADLSSGDALKNEIRKCPPKLRHSCSGGNDPVNGSCFSSLAALSTCNSRAICERGSQGRLCGVCAPGFYRDNSGKCSECAGEGPWPVTFVFLVLIIIPIYLFIFDHDRFVLYILVPLGYIDMAMLKILISSWQVLGAIEWA